ncbi:MAG: EscU/YscU/HrcU family type III secretion system export apparatus switch protein [Hyphomicrobiales bacterium]|nr:EscU/YscU/HrcU family type III secretion system export apparatus switch protein [Hyphomicrobiales bacterium]
MSGNSSSEEKSLPPTQKRLKDLRKKGQVARSTDMVAGASTTAALLLLWLGGHKIGQSFNLTTQASPGDQALDLEQGALSFLQALLFSVGPFFASLLLVNVLVVISVNVLVNKGFLFSLEPMKLDFNKLNPVEGIKNMFALRSLVDLVKLILKVGVFSAMCIAILALSMKAPFNIPFCGLSCFSPVFLSMIKPILILAIALLLTAGIFDIMIQHWLFKRQQRMSKSEAKRERKEQEGAPEIKGAYQQLRRGLLQDGRHNDAEATIIIEGSNAVVGVRFVRNDMPLPIIICKGKDSRMYEILQTASENKISRYYDDDFAIEFYKKSEIGKPLREAFYQPFLKAMKATKQI